MSKEKRTWAVFLRGRLWCHASEKRIDPALIEAPRPEDFERSWYVWRGTMDGKNGSWAKPSIRDIVDMGLLTAADSAHAFYALSLTLANHSTRRVRLRQYAAGLGWEAKKAVATHALQALEALYGAGPEVERDRRLYTATVTISSDVDPVTLEMLLTEALDCAVEVHFVK